jgi:hypothetical protein
MNKLILRILVAAAFGVVLSFTVLGQGTADLTYATCVRRCNHDRDVAIASNNLQRTQVQIQLGRDLIDCNVEYLGNPLASRRCRQEKRAAANARLAQLDASDRMAQRARLRCIAECRRQHDAGTSTPTSTVSGSVPLVGIVTLDCLPGGAPCRASVPEFCTKAASACDQCWRSLCGGGEWSFEAEVPLVVTLLAVSDPSKSPRVIATSSRKGQQTILSVPADIKLGAGEQLYFGFSSPGKPGKAVKVNIQRDKP